VSSLLHETEAFTRSDVSFFVSVPYAASERLPVRNGTRFAEEP
jgi:hypothetical protein